MSKKQVNVVISICFTVLFPALICGCSVLSQIYEKNNHSSLVEETVYNCLNNNDPDGLYDLFSVEAKKNKFLFDRIKVVCFLWSKLDLGANEPIFRYDTGGGKEYKGGKIIYDEQGYGIRVNDEKGFQYQLCIEENRIYLEEPEKEGVFDISLFSGNTAIYRTSSASSSVDEELRDIEDMYERETNIISQLIDLFEDASYISSNDDERVQLSRNLLDRIVSEDYMAYGNYIVDLYSIEETTSNDGNGRHPALRYSFIDGSTFVVIVHNNP